MEDPVKQIPGIIHLLTQSSPSVQKRTLEKYFTRDAAFSHPFCRTGSWEGSREVVGWVYRWYKVMSPRVDLSVQSVAFDQQNLLLYTTIFQIFRIWLVPFYFAPVKLTSVLHLRIDPDDGLYYIAAQEDLYAVDQWIRFIAPGGWVLVWAWQFCATLFCAVGCVVGWPVSWVEEVFGWGMMKGVEVGGKLEGEEEVEKESKEGGKEWMVKDGRTDEEVFAGTKLRGRIIG